MGNNTSERKIDIVYTWVDGNDPEWQKKKAQYAGEIKEEVSNASSRFSDNDELKYSLRSVEKNAPWINHIYIMISVVKTGIYLHNTEQPANKDSGGTGCITTFSLILIRRCWIFMLPSIKRSASC